MELYDLCRSKNIEPDIFEKFCFLVINYIEDKYIDDQIYSKYIGYRDYYISMYNEYFNSESITNILKSNFYRNITLDSYEFRLINISNKNSDLDALPKLREIYELIDFENISRLETQQDRIDLANKISVIVFSQIKVGKKKNYSLFNKNPESSEILNSEQDEKVPDIVEKVKDQQSKFINGETRKFSMDNSLIQKVEVLEKSKMEYQMVGYDGDKVPCFIIKSICSDLFLNSKQYVNSSIIQKGIQNGDLLYNKNKFLPEITKVKISNKFKGKLDSKKLFSASFDDRIFYENFNEVSLKKIFVHLSIDCSYSMNSKWEDTVIFILSLCRLFSRLGKIDYIVSFRETTEGKKSYPVLKIAFDSRKDKFDKLKKIFIYTKPISSTPEGLCFESIHKFFDNSYDKNYLINISDGMPYYKFPNGNPYSGIKAAKHTKKQIDFILNSGIDVFSFFVTENFNYDFDNISKKMFEMMYGKSARIVNIKELSILSNELTKIFYKKIID